MSTEENERKFNEGLDKESQLNIELDDLFKSSKFKEGDEVTSPSYCGILIINNKDESTSKITQKPHWFCVGKDSDTSFDVYGEDDLEING